jgi:hypothetical protein
MTCGGGGAYLVYIEFKDKFKKLNKEDQKILLPYLETLFWNWYTAIDRQNEGKPNGEPSSR